jgi:hypothetical protein
MPDCLSRTGWVRRKLNLKERLTAWDIPTDAQDSTLAKSKAFYKDLEFRNPIGVLRLLGLALNDALSPSPVIQLPSPSPCNAPCLTLQRALPPEDKMERNTKLSADISSPAAKIDRNTKLSAGGISHGYVPRQVDTTRGRRDHFIHEATYSPS